MIWDTEVVNYAIRGRSPRLALREYHVSPKNMGVNQLVAYLHVCCSVRCSCFFVKQVGFVEAALHA